jgi:ABC-2 type transport system ATP-binding protein
MTVTAFLKFVASIRGFKGDERINAVEKVIETCFLQSVRYQPIETLSKGYRHRTCFAQSIIHDPETLVLDEPTDGLDPNQKNEVRNLIKRMSERKAIILSTHILEEVDVVCTKVIIINRGKLVAHGLPAELKKRSNLAGTVTLHVNDCKYADISEKLGAIDEVDKVMCIKEDENSCLARIFPSQSQSTNDQGNFLANRVYDEVKEVNWNICELRTDEGRLDEVFRAITTSDVDERSK